MIDSELLQRYVRAYGHTFTVSHWDRRPGDAVNAMMRAALAGWGPVVTDDQIAAELTGRLGDRGS